MTYSFLPTTQRSVTYAYETTEPIKEVQQSLQAQFRQLKIQEEKLKRWPHSQRKK